MKEFEFDFDCREGDALFRTTVVLAPYKAWKADPRSASPWFCWRRLGWRVLAVGVIVYRPRGGEAPPRTRLPEVCLN